MGGPDVSEVVAPEGQDFQSMGLGWGNANGEDVAFAHAMMDRFGAQLCIDQNRIFSTGFSFGAMFSFTLVHRRARNRLLSVTTSTSEADVALRSAASVGYDAE